MTIEFGDFEVGDQYDLAPSHASKLISVIKAMGGELVVDGNIVVITALPGKEPLPAPVAVEPELAPEPEPAPAPEAKLEEAAALISEYNAEVAAAPEPDLGGTDLGTAEIGTPEEASAPAPVKRGRKPAASKAV